MSVLACFLWGYYVVIATFPYPVFDFHSSGILGLGPSCLTK